MGLNIFYSEIILTIGNSKTVESFLKGAGHYRNFTVIVAETGPSYLPFHFPVIIDSDLPNV